MCRTGFSFGFVGYGTRRSRVNEACTAKRCAINMQSRAEKRAKTAHVKCNGGTSAEGRRHLVN